MPFSQEERNFRVDQVMHSLQAECQGFYYSEFDRDWSVLEASCDAAAFHFLDRGEAVYQVESGPWQMLEAGRVIFLPGGPRHRLASHSEVSCSAACHWETLFNSTPKTFVRRALAADPNAILLCGFFSVTDSRGDSILSRLPSFLTRQHPLEEEVAAAAREILVDITWEALQSAEKSHVSVDGLLNIAFLLLVRSWITALPTHRLGGLGAIENVDIWRLLGQIDADPHKDWTLAELSQSAHLSRSSFTALFRELVGMTPLAYVRNARLDFDQVEPPYLKVRPKASKQH
jgi:hypothetical protein